MVHSPLPQQRPAGRLRKRARRRAPLPHHSVTAVVNTLRQRLRAARLHYTLLPGLQYLTLMRAAIRPHTVYIQEAGVVRSSCPPPACHIQSRASNNQTHSHTLRRVSNSAPSSICPSRPCAPCDRRQVTCPVLFGDGATGARQRAPGWRSCRLRPPGRSACRRWRSCRCCCSPRHCRC